MRPLFPKQQTSLGAVGTSVYASSGHCPTSSRGSCKTIHDV